jgi:hypothetical protein
MPFRVVAGDQAGPAALGILAPPGRRTVLILRPRSLAWDLVLVQTRAWEPGRPATGNGPTTTFRELGREEAEAAAGVLHEALEQWHGGGAGQVQPVPATDGAGYLVRALVGVIPLLACLRQPGQPYRPQLFANLEEARQAADAIRAVLCPAGDAEQELYFNHRHFAR